MLKAITLVLDKKHMSKFLTFYNLYLVYEYQ